MVSQNNKYNYIFNVALAGIPIQICCNYEINRHFFCDYMTEQAPEFSIYPDESLYNRIQENYNRLDQNDGIEPYKRPDSFLENSLIHSLVAEKLVDYNILLMHGSALCLDQTAYLFTAKSGIGKSTHAKLWREMYGDRVRMINDDKPLLKIDHDRVTVYGSPWDGKHRLSNNISAPLKAIVWLNRSETNSIEELSQSEAFPVILTQAIKTTDAEKNKKIINLEKQLLQNVDCYKLSCNISEEAVLTVYDKIKPKTF